MILPSGVVLWLFSTQYSGSVLLQDGFYVCSCYGKMADRRFLLFYTVHYGPEISCFFLLSISDRLTCWAQRACRTMAKTIWYRFVAYGVA